MKIIVNIPGFGERFCPDNVEYKLYLYGYSYRFYKKGTSIQHNEYGPAWENKNGSCGYFINDKYHRLSGYCIINYKSYYVIGKELGETKEEFIKKLANVLIPKEEDEQED